MAVMPDISSTKKEYRILFIDDEPAFLEMYSVKFVAAGFLVKTTSDSEHAFSIISSFRPDLLFLDLVMRGTDGLKLLKQIKETVETKWLPVVVLSNVDNPADKAACEAAGASQFLVKDRFTPGDLLVYARKVLEIV